MPFTKGPDRRRAGGFVEGQSGNPGGRPSIAKALQACDTTQADVLAKLCRICLDALDEPPEIDLDEKPSKIKKAIRSGRVNTEYAHAWLSNYIIGKPRENVSVAVSMLSDDEFMQQYHRFRAEVLADASPPELPSGDDE